MMILAMLLLLISGVTALFGFTGWAGEATSVCLIAFPYFALLAVVPAVFAIAPRGSHGRRRLAH